MNINPFQNVLSKEAYKRLGDEQRRFMSTKVESILDYAAADPGELRAVPRIGEASARELCENGITSAHKLDAKLSELLSSNGGNLNEAMEDFQDWLKENGVKPQGGSLKIITLAIALRVQQRNPELVSSEHRADLQTRILSH
eukprot:gb/GECG01000585.1/.p1 GENE.gb/GECG01000585.1/~~gb/GECG01000585.1/.p1  ORF type:complete len:142 (+),score=20.01 gb/GECG01000585.1/:1-426(+)